MKWPMSKEWLNSWNSNRKKPTLRSFLEDMLDIIMQYYEEHSSWLWVRFRFFRTGFPTSSCWTGNSTSRFLLHLLSGWIQLSRKLFAQNWCISWPQRDIIAFHPLYWNSFCLRAMICFYDMCVRAQFIV